MHRYAVARLFVANRYGVLNFCNSSLCSLYGVLSGYSPSLGSC